MKKICACVLVVMLLPGLCACGQVEQLEETSVPTAQTAIEAAAETTTEAPTTPTEAPTAPFTPQKSEPYSYVLKAYRDFELSGFMKMDEELVQGFHVLPYGCFTTYLMTRLTLPSDAMLHYALYDINKDGVKELLLGVTADHALSINEDQEPTVFDIFTIKDGIACELLQDNAPWNSGVAIMKNGTVRHCHVDRDNPWSTSVWWDYYQFKGSELQFILGAEEWASREAGTEGYQKRTAAESDPVEISEAEYNALRQTYEGDVVDTFAWTPLLQYLPSE